MTTITSKSRIGLARNASNDSIAVSPEDEERAWRIHREATIVDGTALSYTLQAPFTENLLEAGVDAVIATVFVGVETGQGNHTELALRGLDWAHRRIAAHDSNLVLVNTVRDIRKSRTQNKLGVVLAFQNATPFADSTHLVNVFRAMGVRCVQLTYNQRNLVADGCLESRGGGLSLFGIELLHALQEVGIAVDLSHVGDASVDHALEIAAKPLAFTHANARALCDNPRNKTDAQISSLVSAGGVIGLNAFPAFVRNDGKQPFLADLLDHAEYLCELVGPKGVSLGLDFIEGWGDREKKGLRAHPGVFGTSYEFPRSLEGVAQFPNLTRGLVARRFQDSAIRGILGENLLLFLENAWSANGRAQTD